MRVPLKDKKRYSKDKFKFQSSRNPVLFAMQARRDETRERGDKKLTLKIGKSLTSEDEGRPLSEDEVTESIKTRVNDVVVVVGSTFVQLSRERPPLLFLFSLAQRSTSSQSTSAFICLQL